jgi:hypothetical protein
VALWLRETAWSAGLFRKITQLFPGGIQQSRGKPRFVSAKFRKKVILFYKFTSG